MSYILNECDDDIIKMRVDKKIYDENGKELTVICPAPEYIEEVFSFGKEKIRRKN